MADHIDPINAAIAGVVDEHMGGVVAFAALLEQPIPTVSRRLRRADDGKGQRMECHTTYIAAIWTDPVARVALVDRLALLAGRKPTEPLVEVTDAEKAEALASLLNDKAKRQIERERGWPAGTIA